VGLEGLPHPMSPPRQDVVVLVVPASEAGEVRWCCLETIPMAAVTTQRVYLAA